MTAAEFARWYHDELGLNPLPSRPVEGRIRPWLRRFSGLRDGGVPGKLLDRWHCPAIQLATGCRWGLAVVDLDGAMAREVWRCWTMHLGLPPTWEVEHDPAGGMHLWFSIDTPLPFKTVIWELAGARHTAIEVLGDRNLIVAPPSVSPRTNRPYRFRPGRSPRDIEQPAPLPGFVRDAVARAHEVTPAPPPAVRPIRRPRPCGKHLRRDDVMRAVADPVGVARALGVRVADGRPNAAGWYRCHSIFREDRHPSASLSVRGTYWESGLAQACGLATLTLFDLAVALGHAPNLCEAIDLVGSMAGLRSGGHRVAS